MEILTVKEQVDETGKLIGYLVNGISSVPLSTANTEYREVKYWIAAGNTPEPAYTEEEITKKTLTHYTNLVSQHIQSKVDQYNLENSLGYTDVHSCESYGRTEGYTHQAFCLAVWTWNVAVWEYVRNTVFPAVMSGERQVPTEDELIAELPVFSFTQE